MNVEYLNIEQWKNLDTTLSETTFFHSYGWYSVWNKYSGEDIFAIKISLENGGQFFMPYTTNSVAKGLITKYISSPFGTYGGMVPIVNAPMDYNKILLNVFGSKNIEIKQSCANLVDTDSSEFTQIINLQETQESPTKLWSIKHKSSLIKAKEFIEKYEIRETEDLEDWMSFHRIYRKTLSMKTSGEFTGYDFNLFSIIKSTIDRNKRTLYVADRNGTVIGGSLIFKQQQRAIDWCRSVDVSVMREGWSFILFEKIISDLLRQKYHTFDLGTSLNIEGIEHFKKGLGSKKIIIPVICNKTIMLTLYRHYLNLLKR